MVLISWNWFQAGISFRFPPLFLITPLCCFHCSLTSSRFALIIAPTKYWMVYIFILFVSPLIRCVCVYRYSLINTLSWQWCRTVSWIFTASSQGSNTLMWTPPTFKPMTATKWTKQRIEARQWRAELCPWGETFSCFMWSVFTSEMDFFSHLSFKHCTLPPTGKHVSSRGQGVSRSSVFYLCPYALLWYLWSFFLWFMADILDEKWFFYFKNNSRKSPLWLYRLSLSQWSGSLQSQHN